MRRLVAILSAVALSSGVIAGCDESEETEAAERAAAEAAPTPVASAANNMVARFGGVLVNAQRLFVEVLPRADGQVQAHVYDAQGNELTGDAAAKVVVKVQGKDQQQHPVELQWNTETKQFEGSVGAEVQVASGRVEVEVEQEGEEAATGSVEEVAVAPEAQGGGTVVLAGNVASEIRVEADGEVHAVVLDAEGQPMGADAEMAVTVNLKGSGEEPRPVELTWNDEVGHFVGQVEGEVRPGAVELVIEHGGNSHRGRVERVTVAPNPQVGGRVVIAGDHAVELVQSDGKMQAILVDARGRRVTGNANAQLSLRLGAGTNARPVELTWDAEAEKWVGDVEAEVDLAATPIEVTVLAEGRRHHGRFNRGLALGHAHAAAGGRVGVEVPGADVRLRVPGAAVNEAVRAGARINRPGADVRVRAPGARVRAGGAAMVRAGAAVSAMSPPPASEARERAAEARRRAAEARGQAGGSVMGGVSIMGGIGIGN